MVNCDSLESLKLSLKLCMNQNYRRFSLPNYPKFPALRVLELNNVDFYSCDLIEWFLCPLLEDFSLINCFMENNNIEKHDPLRISCPKLETLRIHNLKFSEKCQRVVFCQKLVVSCPKLVGFEYVNCPIACLLFENLQTLKKAVIHPIKVKWCPFVTSELGNNMCPLLAVVSHAECLSLNNHFIQTISSTASDVRGTFPVSLPNLKTLKLTTKFGAFTMDTILKCTPSLECLSLIIQEEFAFPNYWNDLDEVETRTILTRHLRRVEFLEFNGEKLKVDIARVLLEHGNVLEEMVFSWDDRGKYHEKSTETMNVVSKFPKASSTVKLIALLKD